MRRWNGHPNRRCSCGSWWLTICTAYIIFTCYLSLRQSQQQQETEMKESKFPTIRLYATLGGEGQNIGKPLAYKHLTAAPTSNGRTKTKPAISHNSEKNNPLSRAPPQPGNVKKREHVEGSRLEVPVNKGITQRQEPKANVNKRKQISETTKKPPNNLTNQRDAPQVRREGVVLPAEGVVLPAEGVVLPAEGVVLPAEGVVLPAEGVVLPAEEVVKGNPIALDKNKVNIDQPGELPHTPQHKSTSAKDTQANKQKLQIVPEAKKGHQPVKNGTPDRYSNQSLLYLPHQSGFIGIDGRVILLWTGLTARKPLWNFKTWSLKKCPHKCQITNDRKLLNQSSLVLFRLRMLKDKPTKDLREFVKDYDITDLPAQKYPYQVWVDVNQESPMYSHSDEELMAVDKFFDYIVSYLDQSDYTIDYKYRYRRKTTPTKPVNYAANKTKMALWYVSHCNDLSGRAKYVEELTKYNISVDIIGRCTNKTDGCRDYHDVKCITEFRSKYKFYLALENSICSEYITEKYWNTLNSASYSIPIALGARMQEYAAWSPPNSYLHVRNFTGPKALAEHLHLLDRDDSKFNSYHAWRESYEVYMEEREKFDCWLCRMAHEQPVTNRTLYSHFWSRKKLCETRPEPI